ncbi:MAG: endolytic transglycosylase MltG [Butyrivibrio sp.]|nr:endolytic transglycosylase MltG [Butyrivibrio sp.]
MNARKFVLGLLDTAVKIAFVVIVVMLMSKYSKVAYNYGYRIFNQVPVSSGTGRTVSVTISDGDSAKKIAEKLSNVGLITDKNLFVVQEMFSDYHGLEAAGTYELSTSMTAEEMLQIMSAETTAEEGAAGGAETSSSESEQASEDTPEPLENPEETSGD